MRPADTTPLTTGCGPRDGRRLLALLLAAGLALPGCARLEPDVRPYEMELVVDPIMNPERDALAPDYMRRIHECGEAARGGTEATWSGHGCN